MAKNLVEESSEVKEEGRMKKTRPEETETDQKRPEELITYGVNPACCAPWRGSGAYRLGSVGG